MDEPLNVFESNHVGPPWSHVVILGMTIMALLGIAWCIREMLEARRATRQARYIEKFKFNLYEGARFIAGDAEWAKGSKTAIRVTIGQDGKEIERRTGVSHTWTEVERHTEVAPFYVRTARGERVRVEPPDNVLLVDKLDQLEWMLPKWRRRRAEVTPGERVIIEGRLSRGPDPEAQSAESAAGTNTPLGWVMKCGRRGNMHVSTEGLARRHELRSRAFKRTAIALAILNIVAVSMVTPYFTRLFFGHDVVAQYGGKVFYQEQASKGHLEPHHAAIISYAVESDRVVNERVEIEPKDYRHLPSEKGSIWIRHVPGQHWATALGHGTAVNRSWMIISAALLGLAMYIVGRTYRRRRWYEGKMNEKGPGRLPGPTNERFSTERIAVLMSPPRPRPALISADFEGNEVR